MWSVSCLWDVVFVCVENDVCGVYICWLLDVRESSIRVSSTLCPVCFPIVREFVFGTCSSDSLYSSSNR